MTVEVGARGASRGIPGPRQRFAIANRQLGDGTPVVSVIGELDLATVPAFERRLLDVTESGTGEVIVDLTGCSFLDSRGLRALVAARERLERSDRSLALVLSNAIVMRIFQITGFDECFEIRSSLRAAGDHNGHGSRDRESEAQARSREGNVSTAERVAAQPSTRDRSVSP